MSRKDKDNPGFTFEYRQKVAEFSTPFYFFEAILSLFLDKTFF